MCVAVVKWKATSSQQKKQRGSFIFQTVSVNGLNCTTRDSWPKSDMFSY